MDVTVPPLETVTPAPTLGKVILENLYKDEAHEDVGRPFRFRHLLGYVGNGRRI